MFKFQKLISRIIGKPFTFILRDYKKMKIEGSETNHCIEASKQYLEGIRFPSSVIEIQHIQVKEGYTPCFNNKELEHDTRITKDMCKVCSYMKFCCTSRYIGKHMV